MTDTHTHIYFPEFQEEGEGVVNRAVSAGVKHFVLPNVDEMSIPLMKTFHERYPDLTTMAIGLHPTEVKEDWKPVLAIMEKELSSGDYKAIGEVGMDLYWDKSFKKQQEEVFERQLRMAQETGLPVIIHSRDATDATVRAIEKINPSVDLIFHSFTGGVAEVELIRKVCDPYFGINGVVTYKNAQALREALPLIGIDRILLETDSPYLTPVPFRGKRNETSYIVYVRDKVGEVLTIKPEIVEKATDLSAEKIFKL